MIEREDPAYLTVPYPIGLEIMTKYMMYDHTLRDNLCLPSFSLELDPKIKDGHVCYESNKIEVIRLTRPKLIKIHRMFFIQQMVTFAPVQTCRTVNT